MTERRRVLHLLADLGRRAGIRRSAFAVATSLASGVGAVLISLWLKLILNGVARGERGLMTAAAVALGVTVVVQGATAILALRFLAALQFACGRQLVCDIMRAASGPAGIEHYERPEFADRIVLLKQELNYLSGFLPILGEGAALAGRIGLTAVLLAGVHPALLLLPILAVPSVYAGGVAERVVNRANVATAEKRRLEQHLFDLATTASPAKELRIFGLGDEVVRRERSVWADTTDVIGRAQLRAGLVRSSGWLPFAAGYLGAVGFVLHRAGSGLATPGDVLLVMILAGQVNGQVAQLLNVSNRSASALRVLHRYLWLRDYAAQAVAALRPASPAPVPSSLRTGVELRDVSFGYPESGRDTVLHEVNLRIEAGSTVAIVGENGAGKTSLVKLLCRFYEPTSGSITVDGVDLRSFDVDGWRERLSGGFQDFARLELLLQESVGVGNLPLVDDPGSVRAALGRVGADFPFELDCQLGRQWAGGVDLSEGQWQKVAMARAMMRDTPLLLLLDEPTSGLDAHAEHELFELFAGVASTIARRSGAIALLVSHRFSTVRMADHIVVLEGGRVVEQGDHDALIAANGLYSELYAIQARAYE